MNFLALNYKIPANPSRYRVAVWKALRELGAVYLQDGVAAVPQQDGMETALRELREETGIEAAPDRFELLDSERDRNTFYDFYCLKNPVSLKEIRLQPGETDGVMWAGYGKIHWMIRRGKICRIIARQFCRQEKALRARNVPKMKHRFLVGLK